MIYFLEDDDSIRELVIYTLRNTGMEAMGFPRPSAFWEAMQQEELPALVLLDIMLPEEDGVSVLKKLRANRATKTLPVIMLTAKGTEYDQVMGLDYGADDYIPKPFGMMALIARIKAVLRRSAPSEEEQEYVLGDLYVNKNGESMLDNKYEVLIRANDRFVGPGHNSEIVTDSEGNEWMLYHSYDRHTPSKGRYLMIDRIVWENDWPVIAGNSLSTEAEAPVCK